MSFLTRSTEHNLTTVENAILRAPLETEEQVKWELNQTPEAFYERINEISAHFTKGKYTKALAVQRLLDLLYDINQLPISIYGTQAKSRYYLLIFNYINRIRSARPSLTEVVMGRKMVATDQMMYISGIDFSNLSLPGLRVNKALFENCNFSSASLQGLRAASCQYLQCQFTSANMTQSEIMGSSFEGVTLTGSNFSSSKILKTSFVGCDFSEIISSRGQHPLRVNGCNLLACSFREADLRRADFRNTRMTGCDTLDAKKQDAKGLA